MAKTKNTTAEQDRDLLARTMLEASPTAITMARMDDTAEILYQSPAAIELYGDKKSALEIYANPEDRRGYLKELLVTGEVNNFRAKFKRSNGEIFEAATSGRIAEYQGEKIIVSTMSNLTQKMEADALLRTVLETSQAAIIMARKGDGKILYRSPAATDLFGNQKSAIQHYASPIDREHYLAAFEVDDKLDYHQCNFRKKDGNIFTASVSGRITEYMGETVVVTTITDLTQQIMADAIVRTVLDASSANVIMVRISDGYIWYRSPAALSLLGPKKWAKEHYAVTGQRANFITKMKAEGQVDNYKVDALNAQGESFPASISGRIVEYNGEEAIVTSITDLTEQKKTSELIRQVLEACQVPIQMTSVKTGKLLFSTPETSALFGPVTNSASYYVNPEDRTELLKDLRRQGWYKNRKAQFVGVNGRIFWSMQSARLLDFYGEEVAVTNTRDLTEDIAIQKELEEQREMLFQNEKMSALGELLAGVAHELNNPLSVVVGHSLMLREEVDDPETIRRIEKISSAAERCGKIVKTFLAMARQQPTKMETIDINSIVSAAVDVAGYGGGNEALTIKCDLDGEIPDIIADGDQIIQVIINLIINAKQAITKAGEGDQIKVTTKSSKAGDSVNISVKDNGPGIPDKIRARVFEPFFTTKEVGEGTGIGLAFCHRTILSHGGNIWLDSNHTNGSEFIIQLPISEAGDDDSSETKVNSRDVKKIRVLVVDDEVEVAELISEILKKEGFHVDIAHSGAGALTRLGVGKYDLLLSDLNMAGVDGRDLYEALKLNFQEMLDVTAFITGDIMGAASQSLLQESGRPYLEKPISPTELRDLVYGMLDTP